MSSKSKYFFINKKTVTLVAVFLLLTVIIITTLKRANHPDRVTFISVGQGDGILIGSSNNQRLLIDSGPDKASSRAIAELLPFWDKYLDIFILTHEHADHLGGLKSLMGLVKIGKVIASESVRDSSDFASILPDLKALGIPVLYLSQDYNININSEYRLRLLVSTTSKDINEGSVVGILEHGSSTVVLLSDVDYIREGELVDSLNLDHVDMVKVAHHGSDLGTSQRMLDAWKPGEAVISVGRNNTFHHPSGRVLKRLERAKVNVRRTDLDGNLVYSFTPNGLNLEK